MDKVMEGFVGMEMAVEFDIQYLTDLIFDVSFDFYRWWWGLLAEWEWIGFSSL